MAVQFNLLPDVKLEYNRQQHLKRIVFGISALTVAFAVALFILSFVVVDVLQKKLISNSNGDITTYSKKLENIPNLAQVLTIQNQLIALPGLHQQKHITSRLFAYLPQITPVHVNIGQLNMDTTANTIQIQGTADTVQNVNKFIDTLKFTYFNTPGSSNNTPAFTNVLLSTVNRDDTASSPATQTTYTINMNFDPTLFSAAQSVKLNVPQETTTRSVLDTPDASSILFNGQTAKPKTGNQ